MKIYTEHSSIHIHVHAYESMLNTLEKTGEDKLALKMWVFFACSDLESRISNGVSDVTVKSSLGLI